MKEIPILFGTPMVRALLEGRKTMIRRLIKFKSIAKDIVASIHKDGSGKGWIAWTPWPVSAEETKLRYPGNEGFPCPYGQHGDLLWVRENFRVNSWMPDDGELTFRYEADGAVSENVGFDDGDGETFNRYWIQSCDDLYKAGYQPNEEERFVDYKYDALRLRPNIFLPKPVARIWLQVTGIHVERLQEITEKDAIAEGVEKRPGSDSSTRFDYKHYGYDTFDVDAKVSFRTLWEKINGVESWAANPWVWVVSFDMLSTTGKPK